MTDNQQTHLNLANTTDDAALTAGQWLVKARQSSGMSAQDVATRTNRSLAQIMSLEADDYARVGEGVLLRAVVRHYAKVVGADQDQAVQHLPEQYRAAKPTVPDEVVNHHPSRGAPLKSPWINKMWLVILGLVVIALLVYWVMISRFVQGGENTKKVTAPNQVQVINTPAPAVSAPVAPAAPTAQPTAPNIEGSTPAAPATAAPAPTSTPAAPVAGTETLGLKFKGVSSVTILDADGKVLLQGTQAAGTEQSVVGKPPLKVTIGAASMVEAIWKGAAYDLAPATKGDVARIKALN